MLKRFVWLCCLSGILVVAACDPQFISVAVSGIGEKVTTVQVSSTVNDNARSTDAPLTFQQGMAELQYAAAIPSDDVGSWYTLTVEGLDSEGCTIQSGTTALALHSPSRDASLHLEVQLKDVPRTCPLDIAKTGPTLIENILMTEQPLPLAKNDCRPLSRPICMSSASSLTDTSLSSTDYDNQLCARGCNCPAKCDAKVQDTIELKLTLNPPQGYHASWDSCDGTLVGLTCTVKMSKPRHLRITVVADGDTPSPQQTEASSDRSQLTLKTDR